MEHSITSRDSNGNSNNVTGGDIKQKNGINILNLDDSSTFKEGFILDPETLDYLYDVPSLMVQEEVLQKCIEEIQLQNSAENISGEMNVDFLNLSKYNTGFNGTDNYSNRNYNDAEISFPLPSLHSKQSQQITMGNSQADLHPDTLSSSNFAADRFQHQQGSEFQQQWQQHQNHHLHQHQLQQQHTLYSQHASENHKVTCIASPSLDRHLYGNQNLTKDDYFAHIGSTGTQFSKTSVPAVISPQLGRKIQAQTSQDYSGHNFLPSPDSLPSSLTLDGSLDLLSTFQGLQSSACASPMHASTPTHSRHHSLSLSPADGPSPQMLSPIPPRIPLPHEVSFYSSALCIQKDYIIANKHLFLKLQFNY